jgi:hypothetical protein
MLLHIQLLLLLLQGIELLLDEAGFETATLTCQRNSACTAYKQPQGDVSLAHQRRASWMLLLDKTPALSPPHCHANIPVPARHSNSRGNTSHTVDLVWASHK